MADDISVKIAVEGEQNFKTAISAANAQLKSMDAELQAAVSSMTGMESAEQKLAAKSSILNQQIEKNKEKLSILSQQYEKSKAKLDELGQALEKAKAEHGDNSAEATKAANAYNRQAQEVAKLEKDIANTNTAINKETAELNQLNNTLEKTGERWQEAGAKISDAGEKITSVGSTLTKTVTAPLVAAGTAAAKFASDYEENLNKVDASFKDNAAEVKAWAKTATQQFGMSESAALDATSAFGDMGTSMGLSTKEAADMSTSLAGLAGDLSSFKNIGIDQAMSALKGVFTGETEGLKSIGVVMTETNLKAFAEDMGLVYDSMSQAEKVTLRYQYVLANTTNAQGDYARTSDGTANSIRTLQAEASNLAAAFGQELLPEITPLIQKATEMVRGFGELDEETKRLVIQVGLLAAGVGPVVTVAGKLTEGTGKAASAIGTLTKYIAGGGGLNIALGAGAIAAVGLGTAFVNAAIDANSMDDATRALYDAMEETTAQGEAQRTEIEGNSAAALALVGDLESLADKENKSAAEKQRMTAMVESLNDLVPDLGASYDDLSDSLNMSTDAMRDFIIQSAKTEALASYQSELADLYKQQYEALSNLNKKKDAATSANDSYNSTVAEQNRLLEQGTIDQSMYNDKIAVARVEVDNTNRALNDAQVAYDAVTAQVQECEGNLVGYTEATDTAKTGIEKLSEAQNTATESATEMTEAEQKVAEAFAQMVTDLEGVPELLSATGYSSQELATMLTAAGVSVDQFASGVSSMRDSVVNDFKLISGQESISAADMAATLEANLAAQQNWSQNLTQLWWQAYSDQDAAVMEYINYLADMGPDYAATVAEFANGGYGELQRSAAAWQAIGEQSAQDYAAGIWMDNYLAEQAGAGLGDAAVSGGQSVDASPVGQEYVDQVVGTVTANQGTAEAAMAGMGEGMAGAYKNTKSVAQAATDTVTSGMIDRIRASYNGMKTAGAGLVTYLNAGVATKLSASRDVSRSVADAIKAAIETYNQPMKTTGAGLITYLNAGIVSNASGSRSASQAVAEAAKAAAGSVSFYGVGYNMAAGVASGIYGGSYLINNAAYTAARRALYTAKSALGIHSPSKEFRDQVGAMIPAGIVEGVEDETGQVVSAMKRLGDTALNSINSSMTMPIVQRVEQPAGAASNRNVNCSINVQVYQQPGQDANEFADIVVAKVERSVRQRGMGIS